MSLEQYSLEELRREVKRREEKLEEERKKEIARRTVLIVCPSCNGKGSKTSRDVWSGWDYDEECKKCEGSGSCEALLR